MIVVIDQSFVTLLRRLVGGSSPFRIDVLRHVVSSSLRQQFRVSNGIIVGNWRLSCSWLTRASSLLAKISWSSKTTFQRRLLYDTQFPECGALCFPQNDDGFLLCTVFLSTKLRDLFSRGQFPDVRTFSSSSTGVISSAITRRKLCTCTGTGIGTLFRRKFHIKSQQQLRVMMMMSFFLSSNWLSFVCCCFCAKIWHSFCRYNFDSRTGRRSGERNGLFLSRSLECSDADHGIELGEVESKQAIKEVQD